VGKNQGILYSMESGHLDTNAVKGDEYQFKKDFHCRGRLQLTDCTRMGYEGGMVLSTTQVAHISSRYASPFPGYLRSLMLVPIESPFTCNFLLANNSNLHPVSHCFPVIVQYCSNYRLWQGGASLINSFSVISMDSVGVEPLNSRTWNLASEMRNIASRCFPVTLGKLCTPLCICHQAA